MSTAATLETPTLRLIAPEPPKPPKAPLLVLNQLQEDLLYETYADPALSFFDLARMNNLTLDQLIAWLETPAVQQKLDTIEAHTHRRDRFTAAAARHHATEGFCDVIRDHVEEGQVLKSKPTPETARHDRLARETVRKASAPLMRAAGQPSAKPHRPKTTDPTGPDQGPTPDPAPYSDQEREQTSPLSRREARPTARPCSEQVARPGGLSP